MDTMNLIFMSGLRIIPRISWTIPLRVKESVEARHRTKLGEGSNQC